MIEPGKVFTEEQKAAIDVLIKAGFVAFVEAKIDDVRELGTGKRQPTWKHQKRYAMVLALQDDPVRPRKPSLMEKARAARIATKKKVKAEAEAKAKAEAEGKAKAEAEAKAKAEAEEKAKAEAEAKAKAEAEEKAKAEAVAKANAKGGNKK